MNFSSNVLVHQLRNLRSDTPADLIPGWSDTISMYDCACCPPRACIELAERVDGVARYDHSLRLEPRVVCARWSEANIVAEHFDARDVIGRRDARVECETAFEDSFGEVGVDREILNGQTTSSATARGI